MSDLIREHFELLVEMIVLLVVFVVGAVFLAAYPENERLAAWITGGTIVGVLARALTRGGQNGKGDKA